jgi:hypothetical protein
MRRKPWQEAERFVPTLLREWAYAQAYLTSPPQHLSAWLHQYNWHRPHNNLKSKPPITRIPCRVIGATKGVSVRLLTQRSRAVSQIAIRTSGNVRVFASCSEADVTDAYTGIIA